MIYRTVKGRKYQLYCRPPTGPDAEAELDRMCLQYEEKHPSFGTKIRQMRNSGKKDKTSDQDVPAKEEDKLEES